PANTVTDARISVARSFREGKKNRCEPPAHAPSAGATPPGSCPSVVMIPGPCQGEPAAAITRRAVIVRTPPPLWCPCLPLYSRPHLLVAPVARDDARQRRRDNIQIEGGSDGDDQATWRSGDHLHPRAPARRVLELRRDQDQQQEALRGGRRQVRRQH